MRSRKLPRPKTAKETKRFIGAVNYVSNFFPKVQEILSPLHKITNKRRNFEWTNVHQNAFDKIKELMVKPPILKMPTKNGRFKIYSDTSRTATGSYLTQTVNDEEHIIGYYSKVLPEACKRYSVTELELFGLYINISAFKHLLKGCEFDAFVDHSAIVQIWNSKDQPCTNRLQKLILRLSGSVFKIGYKKGTELVLADFLSRAPRDEDSEIDQIVPIAFTCSEIDTNDSFNPTTQTISRPVTRSYARKMGIKIPDLYKPKQTQINDTSTTQHTTTATRPQTSPQTDTQHQSPTPPLTTPSTLRPSTDPLIVPPLSIPDRPKQQPTVLREQRLVDKENNDITYRDVPIELYTSPSPLVPTITELKTTHIPKQKELDKLMDVIRRKIIRDYNLPVDVKQLQIEQETSPFFKPVYDYLAHDILPADKKAARAIQTKSEQYILCNGLFRFFLQNKGDDFILQLAIP
ncbi:uncharacterized protein LOC117119582, partial [Anneissia japonica]|uniref:uncharacterized protein LOC117119582 n=1 Tax=Anneissia japonica TaxID=1529436 RepID=UPI0014256175